MLSEDEIASLEAELEDLCLETNAGNEARFSTDDILHLRAAAETRRVGINHFPGAKLLSRATKSVASTRFVSSSLCRVIEREVATSSTLMNIEENRADKLKEYHTESSLCAVAIAVNVSSHSTGEAVEPTKSAEGEVSEISSLNDAARSSNSASQTRAEINDQTCELDLDLSFDVLIEQAATKSQDHSRFIEERHRVRELEQEKLKHQYFVVESMSSIITKQWIGSALDRWLKFIQARNKAERILGRVCRHCLRKGRFSENENSRSRLDVLVQMNIQAHNAVLIVDSGFIYLVIFNLDRSGKILGYVRYICCQAFLVELELNSHHWNSGWSHTLSAWIPGLLCKMRVLFIGVTDLNKYFGTRQVICYTGTQMLQCRHPESCMKFMRAMQSIILKRALKRFFDHKQQFTASYCIQHAYI
jgi:hypothetical protein